MPRHMVQCRAALQLNSPLLAQAVACLPRRCPGRTNPSATGDWLFQSVNMGFGLAVTRRMHCCMGIDPSSQSLFTSIHQRGVTSESASR